MTCVVLEDAAYGLRDSLELMSALGLSIGQMRSSGGGARSALWRQILSDVVGTPIVTVKVTKGVAYGLHCWWLSGPDRMEARVLVDRARNGLDHGIDGIPL